MALNWKKRAYAPHCDASVLHAPGTCEFCDLYPEWQEYRQLARISFTGQKSDQLAPCPSTYFRSAETVDRWPGNRKSLTRLMVSDMPTWQMPNKWKPGDPCGVCGGTDTGMDTEVGAFCRRCGATDADE